MRPASLSRQNQMKALQERKSTGEYLTNIDANALYKLLASAAQRWKKEKRTAQRVHVGQKHKVMKPAVTVHGVLGQAEAEAELSL